MTVFSKRLEKLQQAMVEQNISVCIFFHYTEIAYFTGISLGNFLIIPASSTPKLFTRKAYERTKEMHISLDVFPYRRYEDILPFIEPISQSNIAIPFSSTSYAQIQKIQQILNLNTEHLIDAQKLINQVTQIKTEEEIQSIKMASDGIKKIFQDLNPLEILGKSEAHLSGLLYSRLRDIGFIGEYQFRNSVPFTGPAVLTKESICAPSQLETTYTGYGIYPILSVGSGHTIIEKDIPFVIDIMNNQEGIFTDITRTFIIGKPSFKLEKRYKDLIQIYNYIQSICKVGRSFTDIYLQTLEIVKELGYQDHFMGLKPNQSPFIGHSIGAWVDEFPVFSKNMNIPLMPNMTFAMEPKFYFSDFDSPGLESTFVQRSNGLEDLTNIPIEISVL